MLRIPTKPDLAQQFCKELVDECMASSEERGMVYQKATQYYFAGTGDVRAAIHNKIKTFVDRIAGYYFQPQGVRFNLLFDSNEAPDVLERARACGQMLTADYRSTDTDLRFATAVTWSLVNGNYFLKHWAEPPGFRAAPVHPVNMGVLSESLVSLDEQEAFCHVSYPTVTRLRGILDSTGNPRRNQIIERIMEARAPERDGEEPSFFHQMVVGGMNPLGDTGSTPSAAGIVQVFPVPTPWRPQRRVTETVKFCELWIKDRERGGDYTTVQLVYGPEPIIIEGIDTPKNLSGVPGHHPFVQVQADEVPGYFWGRSIIADVQMLQDVINKRLRDIKVMWDRNAAAPYSFAGFNSITEEQYYKLISEGGFISDPNPNAKAAKLTEPPPPGYLEELEFLWKLFDEAGGMSPIMTGQGEPSVRAGVHAQTLVRTSSPGLIDPAVRIERQLADSGYLSMRIMANNDPRQYSTESGMDFYLQQFLDAHPNFQVEVDSHSASPAFAEDSKQIAIALARAQAIGAEDLIEMLDPPNASLLLAHLRERKAAMAKQQQQEAAQAAATGQPPPGQGASRRPAQRH
jgi:hypothetical protein